MYVIKKINAFADVVPNFGISSMIIIIDHHQHFLEKYDKILVKGKYFQL